MCAVHDGRCSPLVMCSVVSGNRIHDTYINGNIYLCSFHVMYKSQFRNGDEQFCGAWNSL